MHNASVLEIATLLLTSIVLSTDVASAARQSGLQVTPDGKRTLISKDVGDERWAITLNADDGSITGNVFRRDGGAPQFVWCDRTGASGNSLRSSAARAPMHVRPSHAPPTFGLRYRTSRFRSRSFYRLRRKQPRASHTRSNPSFLP